MNVSTKSEMTGAAGVIARGKTLVEGAAKGAFLRFAVPLSFWGGLDPETGLVIDRSHPACGMSLAGVVLAMPSGRGSSSSSSVLAEAIRRGTGPVAILLGEPDPIIVVGALVARRLYGRACPVVVWTPPAGAVADGARVQIEAGEREASVLRGD